MKQESNDISTVWKRRIFLHKFIYPTYIEKADISLCLQQEGRTIVWQFLQEWTEHIQPTGTKIEEVLIVSAGKTF